MSLFSEKYEAFLHIQLTEWAEKHRWDGLDAIKSFFSKVEDQTLEGTGYYGWQGPASYQIAWRGDNVVKAEVVAGAAQFVLRDLAEGHAPSEVLDEITKAMRRAVKEAVTVGNSGFHFEVARTIGKAAIELLEDNWEFNWIAHRAQNEAEEAVTPEDTREELSSARKRLSELKKQRSGMRSETRIAKVNDSIEQVERTIGILERIKAQAIEEAKQEQVTTV